MSKELKVVTKKYISCSKKDNAGVTGNTTKIDLDQQNSRNSVVTQQIQ